MKFNFWDWVVLSFVSGNLLGWIYVGYNICDWSKGWTP